MTKPRSAALVQTGDILIRWAISNKPVTYKPPQEDTLHNTTQGCQSTMPDFKVKRIK